jgi:hypothetical protein
MLARVAKARHGNVPPQQDELQAPIARKGLEAHRLSVNSRSNRCRHGCVSGDGDRQDEVRALLLLWTHEVLCSGGSMQQRTTASQVGSNEQWSRGRYASESPGAGLEQNG